MIAVRISILAAALLLPLALACASEDAAPAPNEPPQAVSAPPPAVASAISAAPPPTASVVPTQPPSPTAASEPEERDLEIVTLLPFDAIPAILDPEFISADEADAKLAELRENRSRGAPDDALVLGVSVNGDSRAYYIPTLSRVEIVNDTVGGQPLAVTW